MGQKGLSVGPRCIGTVRARNPKSIYLSSLTVQPYEPSNNPVNLISLKTVNIQELLFLSVICGALNSNCYNLN